VVGVLEVKLVLPGCRSLKDKRRVLNSLKDRLRHGFNVTVAEVESQELWQVAGLAVAQVSGDGRYVRGSLEQVLNLIRRMRDIQLSDYSIELFHH